VGVGADASSKSGFMNVCISGESEGDACILKTGSKEHYPSFQLDTLIY